MPTTIDAENAKQIRESMEVYVSLDAVDYDQNITVSAGTAKLKDTSTISENYPLRKLADLQNGGFPLDGSCVLYDSTEVASQANGKIGIRGNLAANVQLTISSSNVINLIMVTVPYGCDEAKIGNTTYSIDEDSKFIFSGDDLRNTSITFYPAESYERVEVSQVVAGLQLEFDNEDIISINLSLRSDLKPIDPTLPESEIEINAYYPYDISKALSTIQDDKPITYQAGYDSDLCEERKFYLSEPATWEKGMLTIKGVDAVRKLDRETFPIFIGSNTNGTYSTAVQGAFRMLYLAMADQLQMAGILTNYYDQQAHMEAAPASTVDASNTGTQINSIIKRQSQRDMLANFMNLMRYNLTGFGISSFWPTYVDAGIPTLTWTKPSIKWDIYESDCGDVKTNIDRKIIKINYDGGTIRSLGTTYVKTNGSATAFKDSGLALSYGDYTTFQRWYTMANNDTRKSWTNSSYDSQRKLPASSTLSSSTYYGLALFDSSVEKNVLLLNQKSSVSSSWVTWRNWNSTCTNNWNALVNTGTIDSYATSIDAETDGRGFSIEENVKSVTKQGAGIEETASKTSWFGIVRAKKLNSSTAYALLPEEGMNQVIRRSNETGSFTWKGDPRMQPRDFFNFHRLNGTTEVCTIESISLKHEKGGTSASIAYRKGYV